MTLISEHSRRVATRRRLALAVAAAGLLVVLLVVASYVNQTRDDTTGSPAGAPEVTAPEVTAPEVTAPGDGSVPAPGADEPGGGAGDTAPPGGWDTAGEAVLAAAPMPVLPAAAAAPAPLTAGPVPAPITVPGPSRPGPLGIDEGFPPTPEGAVGQLAALDTVALQGLDPGVYAAAYRAVSLPGAPEPATTPAGQVIGELNATVDTTTTPIAARWQLTSALVKGVADGGRQVVVCVLGELQATATNTVSTGAGDCQALRYTGRDWRIAPGPSPAGAPAAWPGTDAAHAAGYHPVLTADQTSTAAPAAGGAG